MLVNYLFENYPQRALFLYVRMDNVKAVSFYRRMGLKIKELYTSPGGIDCAIFETPLDKRGCKISINDPDMAAKQV